MLRVAVVDDDAQDRAKISAGLDFVAAQKDVSFSISEFDSGDQFLVKYEPNYDIVFMDVEFLSGANGIEAAHQLRKIDKTVVGFRYPHGTDGCERVRSRCTGFYRKARGQLFLFA